jgi:hypothetical protein
MLRIRDDKIHIGHIRCERLRSRSSTGGRDCHLHRAIRPGEIVLGAVRGQLEAGMGIGGGVRRSVDRERFGTPQLHESPNSVAGGIQLAAQSAMDLGHLKGSDGLGEEIDRGGKRQRDDGDHHQKLDRSEPLRDQIGFLSLN